MKHLLISFCLISGIVDAETHSVIISDFKFTPNDLTIRIGDTVTWTNEEGFHDVTEDNNRFSSGPPSPLPFTFSQTFNSIEEIRYYCTVHSLPGRDIDRNMNGRINVIAAGNDFTINQGIAGAWFFPETSGSGLMIDVRPESELFFAAWFTYEQQNSNNKVGSPDNRWLTATGPYVGDTASELPLFQTSGGFFDNPQEVDIEQVGTMTLQFSDCNTGFVNYSFTNSELSGSFPIQRAIAGTQSLCERLNGE